MYSGQGENVQLHVVNAMNEIDGQHKRLSVRLDNNKKLKLFHYSAYFCYYSWTLLHFLALFRAPLYHFN